MARRQSWRNFLQPSGEPKVKRGTKIGIYEYFTDNFNRQKRAQDIYAGIADLEEAARKLRLSSDGFVLHAATLVDAALEALHEGMVNLCEDKPRKAPTEKEHDYSRDQE